VDPDFCRTSYDDPTTEDLIYALADLEYNERRRILAAADAIAESYHRPLSAQVAANAARR